MLILHYAKRISSISTKKNDDKSLDWRGKIHDKLKQIVLDLFNGTITPTEAASKTEQLNERVIS